jgi:phage tail protein X
MEANGLFQKQKPKLYIGYDHYADGPYFEGFRRLYGSLYEPIRDNSLAREIDGDDAEDFLRQAKDGAMQGCAAAVILCGARTHLGKFVDWEIKAALDRKLSLIGIILPTNPGEAEGKPWLPQRLQANFDGGFAVLCRWQELASTQVDFGTRFRFALAQPTHRIDNSLPLRSHNG